MGCPGSLDMHMYRALYASHPSFPSYSLQTLNKLLNFQVWVLSSVKKMYMSVDRKSVRAILSNICDLHFLFSVNITSWVTEQPAPDKSLPGLKPTKQSIVPSSVSLSDMPEGLSTLTTLACCCHSCTLFPFPASPLTAQDQQHSALSNPELMKARLGAFDPTDWSSASSPVTH